MRATAGDAQSAVSRWPYLCRWLYFYLIEIEKKQSETDLRVWTRLISLLVMSSLRLHDFRKILLHRSGLRNATSRAGYNNARRWPRETDRSARRHVSQGSFLYDQKQSRTPTRVTPIRITIHEHEAKPVLPSVPIHFCHAPCKFFLPLSSLQRQENRASEVPFIARRDSLRL
jgi:hypothetical protein